MALFSPRPPQGADQKMYFFLFLLTLGTTIGYQGWTLLYTNFAVESAGLSAAENGLVQSLREVPGLLGFLIIPLLLLMREHRIAVFAALATGVGTALTGFFPSLGPVLLTTLIMSIGFHVFEAVNQSLLLQYFDTRTTPLVMGRLRGLAAGGSLAVSVFVFFCSEWLSFSTMFLLVGGLCVCTGIWGMGLDPQNASLPVQRKKLILRGRYWLFYILTLLAGGRRQIFTVFALFLLVEKFQFSVHSIAVLFMINYAINWFLNPLIGKAINRIGERRLLSIEYGSAILIFCGYALTDSPVLAGILYVLDYIIYNFAIALRTFFQKIADPADIATSMAVAQTINHVAAVFVPTLGGWLWVTVGYQVPFFIGAVLSGVSLLLVQQIDREIRLKGVRDA